MNLFKNKMYIVKNEFGIDCACDDSEVERYEKAGLVKVRDCFIMVKIGTILVCDDPASDIPKFTTLKDSSISFDVCLEDRNWNDYLIEVK